MATIKISRAKSCSAAIDYARGRNQLRDPDREWLIQNGVPFDTVNTLNDRAVAVSGQLVDPDYAKSQMKQTRELFQNAGSSEAMRVIQSFSHEDLDPLNPADWQRCNDLGNELAQRIAPNHQVAVYTHIDGQGHMLHNHIIINMPNLETGKKYNHNNDWQRVCNIANQISREHGLTVIDHEKSPTERRTMAERQLTAKHKYVWKDDLRARIDKVMLDSSTSSYKDFSARLAHSGVIIHDRGKNFSYEFLDADKKHRRARGKTLGADYEKETILNELERQNRQPTTELPRFVEPSRQIKQREQSTEQRKQHLESRKPAIIQSGQSVNRLTIAIGRAKQATHDLGTNYNRQHHRKRQLRERITSLTKHFREIGHQINQFIQRLDCYNRTVNNFQQRLKADQQAKQQAFQSFQQRFEADQKIQKQHELEQQQLNKSFPI